MQPRHAPIRLSRLQVSTRREHLHHAGGPDVEDDDEDDESGGSGVGSVLDSTVEGAKVCSMTPIRCNSTHDKRSLCSTASSASNLVKAVS